jgi:hypothetical protein
MCCSFTCDLTTGQLTQNVQQLHGHSGLYLGRQSLVEPAGILVLNSDMQSLTVFPGENDEDELPRGDVKLPCKVNGVWWTPFSHGLTVLYELRS